MGLRFRKSISLFPGVRLNLNKSGMSVSAGVPGFRKTINTKGQVTTTTGIPGTGLYYVDTKRINSNRTSNARSTIQPYPPRMVEEHPMSNQSNSQKQNDYVQEKESPQIDVDIIKSIHKTSDDTIDWTEILVSPTAPNLSYNQDMWSYYYSVAPDILDGNIDTYLQLIYEVNPLNDLLEFATNFEFGTDDSGKIEVEFIVNEALLSDAKYSLSKTEYNDLLQDYICSLSIRIARDMFALLPITHTIVHSVLKDKTVLSVDFDRDTLAKVKFGFIDPSDTTEKFKHNMDFDLSRGFYEVNRL